MASPSSFPHLTWTYEGPFEPSFNGNRMTPEGVRLAKADRVGHAARIRGQLASMRNDSLVQAEERIASGLPEIEGKGFLLKVPEDTDADALAYALGIELVAETEDGLMFAATDDLDLERLEEVLSKFEIDLTGGGSAAYVFDVFHDKDDERKLAELLVGRVYQL